jgi:hypothetical protein
MNEYVHLKRLALVTSVAVGLFVSAMPVQAATKTPTSPTGTMSQAQAMALVQSLPPPTPAQLAAAMQYASAHPLQGSVVLIPAEASKGVNPYVTIGVYWWGARLNLTHTDIYNILVLVATGGFAAAGIAICVELGPYAPICGIVGAVFGYMVAEIVWNQLWNNHGCGAWIQDRWVYPSGWSWGRAC